MSSTFGKNIVYSLFGESHGPMIGITIHHLPAGITLDLEAIQKELDLRRPGQNNLVTPRKEMDEFEFVSGYFNDVTTGAPLTGIIYNRQARSRDYHKVKNIMRPSHADYAAFIKYEGHNDYRGGGHFSGRMTAPIVLAGAIAKQLLQLKGIDIKGKITQVGSFKRQAMSEEAFLKNDSDNKNLQKRINEEVIKAKEDHDSVGGAIEVRALNVPAGIGEPFFHSVESTLSQLFYSIPAVKGVAFGLGEQFASQKGSLVNDEIRIDDEIVRMLSNNNGGITGGISNGMPIVSTLYFKPTPTIAKKQKTIDVSLKENVSESIKGRHDPCIVLRAVPVVEAMMAMGILEMFMDYQWSSRW